MKRTTPDRRQPEPARDAPGGAVVDAVSAVLDGMQAECRARRACDPRDPWRLDLVAGPATFLAVEHGRALVRSASGVVEAGPGDVVVVPSSSLPATAQESDAGTSAGTRLLVGSLATPGQEFQPLQELLPDALHLAGTRGRFAPGLEEPLAILGRECDGARTGSRAMRAHATRIVFLHAVRACVEGRTELRSGWLRALASPELGAVLGELHRRPDMPWTVQMMARRAGLSRTVFAERFRASLDSTPVRYLLECRMRRALELMHDEHASLKQIADRVGYGTEAAFSHAFKRWSGRAPSEYRARHSGQ